MPDPTREEMVEALRFEIDHNKWKYAGTHLAALKAALREIEAGGWRPITEPPTEPMAVEFYHGNWPTGPEQYDRQKRTHGYWSGNAWIDDGTNHEVFEWPDMVDNHPTHWRRQCAPPAASDGGEG